MLSINPPANVFVFGDFKAHHKDRLTYSGGTGRPGNSVVIISNDLTQIVIFPTWISDCDSHSMLFWISFFLLLVFVLQWLSLQ